MYPDINFKFGAIISKKQTLNINVEEKTNKAKLIKNYSIEDKDDEHSKETVNDEESCFYHLSNFTISNNIFIKRIQNFIFKNDNTDFFDSTKSISWTKNSIKCVIYISNIDEDEISSKKNSEFTNLMQKILENDVHLICLNIYIDQEKSKINIKKIKKMYNETQQKSYKKDCIEIIYDDKYIHFPMSSMKYFFKSLKSSKNILKSSLNFLPDSLFLDLSKIKKIQKIGYGASSEVFLGKNTENGQKYALKILTVDEDVIQKKNF